MQQLYERIPAASPAAAAAARYDFFVGTLWPRIRDSAAGGLLLFVPSYFDFVRLRNFLLEEEASFVGVCEYSKPGDVTRSRSRFFHQQRRLLMYTERAHFYNR